VQRIVAGSIVLVSCAIGSTGCGTAPRQPAAMSFFITSVGPGDGGNLGGLDGADAHCQKLAAASGAGGRKWRAYLSAPAVGIQPAVNARDRIGQGPWFNAKGVQIAANLAGLHGDNLLNATNSLTELGDPVKASIHDILTGSTPDGRLAGTTPDMTCHAWTSNSGGRAMLGHHNRGGGGDRPTSWNSAHQSASCSARGFDSTGGAGLFYCFAEN
jgi:hypothetical protein